MPIAIVLSFMFKVPETVLSSESDISEPKIVVPAPAISLDRLSPRLKVPSFVTVPVIFARLELKLPVLETVTFCPIEAEFVTSPEIIVEPLPVTFCASVPPLNSNCAAFEIAPPKFEAEEVNLPD